MKQIVYTLLIFSFLIQGDHPYVSAMGTSSFIAPVQYDRAVLRSLAQFEKDIGHKIALPSWMPISAYGIKAIYDKEQQRFVVRYQTAFKNERTIDIYIHSAEKDNRSLDHPAFYPVELRNGSTAYYRDNRSGGSHTCILHLDHNGSRYTVILQSKISEQHTAKQWLTEIANSIVSVMRRPSDGLDPTHPLYKVKAGAAAPASSVLTYYIRSSGSCRLRCT